MKKIILILAVAFISSNLFAQISHNLTIYSEDGLEFTLIVNGQKINDTPMANVVLKDTENDYVNIKINFKDKEISSIKRNNLQIATPGQRASAPVATVYRIIEKRGKNKLRFVSRSAKKIQPKEVIIIKKEEDKKKVKIKIGDIEISK